MNGLNFNGKHSYFDFNLIMNNKTINTPSKKKVKDSIVGMNSIYDFSTTASGGEIVYNQREINVTFTLVSANKSKLHNDLTKISEWLQDCPQSKLIFDDIKSYYFLSEVEDALTFKEDHDTAEIIVKFICEPFKTSISFVGDDIWDNFNFEEDIMQDVFFNIVNTSTVSIYNFGRSITPIINCTSAMSLIVRGITYNLVIGDNKLYKIRLLNGYNSIVIIGTGTIKFLFQKVVI